MESPERTRRRPSPGELFCYAALVILVAIPLCFPGLGRSRNSLLAGGNASAPIRPPSPEIILPSRYAVGAAEVLRANGQALPKELLQGVDAAATSPADRFRALLVRRDVKGPAAADPDLEKMEADPRLGPDARLILQRDGQKITDGPVSTPQELREHHGWFGDLALSQGLSAEAPERAGVIHAAERTMAALVSGTLVVLVALLAGLGLLALLIVWRVTGKLRPVYPGTPHLPVDRRAYLEGFTLYLTMMIAVPLALTRVKLPYAVSTGLYVGSPLVAIGWALWRTRGPEALQQFCAATGLHRGRGVLREMRAGIVGYLAGLPLLAIGAILAFVLIKISGNSATHPIEGEISADPVRIVLLFTLACVFAPVFEETMFRGFFYTHLRSRLGYVLSGVISAFVFAAIHPQGWPAIPALGALAFTFATMREYRGSLIPSMTAHALNNAFVLALLTVAIP